MLRIDKEHRRKARRKPEQIVSERFFVYPCVAECVCVCVCAEFFVIFIYPSSDGENSKSERGKGPETCTRKFLRNALMESASVIRHFVPNFSVPLRFSCSYCTCIYIYFLIFNITSLPRSPAFNFFCSRLHFSISFSILLVHTVPHIFLLVRSAIFSIHINRPRSESFVHFCLFCFLFTRFSHHLRFDIPDRGLSGTVENNNVKNSSLFSLILWYVTKSKMTPDRI